LLTMFVSLDRVFENSPRPKDSVYLLLVFHDMDLRLAQMRR
jgi:hypothetical protein